MLTRPPVPALRPLINRLWASQEPVAPGQAQLERVLPTGTMHLVFRFGAPLVLGGDKAHTVGRSVIGGARATAYLRDVSRPSASVGAQLAPGASLALLGVPAGELTGRHTALEDVWGSSVTRELHARLEEARTPDGRLVAFERMLLARLPRVRGVHPVIALALERLDAAVPVGHIVEEVGYSHRGFTALFEREVGLTPRRFARVRRLQRVLSPIVPDQPWAALALDAGYADQPHLVRELRALTGLTPSQYRRAAPENSHHVPVR